MGLSTRRFALFRQLHIGVLVYYSNMLKILVYSVSAVLLTILIYLGAFLGHQGYLNDFCENNSNGVKLSVIESRISTLRFVKSEIIKGQLIEDIWVQPRFQLRSSLVPEFFGCQILLSKSENEDIMFITGGYNVVEIESPLGVYSILFHFVN